MSSFSFSIEVKPCGLGFACEMGGASADLNEVFIHDRSPLREAKTVGLGRIEATGCT
jgi:hypothetical protein